jgi:hypothetical protein
MNIAALDARQDAHSRREDGKQTTVMFEAAILT